MKYLIIALAGLFSLAACDGVHIEQRARYRPIGSVASFDSCSVSVVKTGSEKLPDQWDITPRDDQYPAALAQLRKRDPKAHASSITLKRCTNDTSASVRNSMESRRGGPPWVNRTA